MARLRLIVWDAGEAERRATALRRAGHEVVAGPLAAAELKSLKANPPDAIVIDLSRRPMTGRDVGLALRQPRALRGVPQVFLEGGAPAAAMARHLPGATFASWRGARGAVKRALEQRPSAPMPAPSVFAGYSGTPLPKKLGVKPGDRVLLVSAPPGVARTLGSLPEGARLTATGGTGELVLWFVDRRAELERRIRAVAARATRGHLWILWPKQASGRPGDLTQADVRRIGLASDLVDYKVCAFDATWSGLKFAPRRA